MGSSDKPFPSIPGLEKVNGSEIQQPEINIRAHIPPNIVPTSYVFKQVQGNDGSIAMVLELHTPSGIHITFWPEGSGETFAAEMLRVARATKAGMVLPNHKLNPHA